MRRRTPKQDELLARLLDEYQSAIAGFEYVLAARLSVRMCQLGHPVHVAGDLPMLLKKVGANAKPE